MAKVEFKKGDDYIKKLERLEREARYKVIGPAIYEGAKIVADSVQSGISSIPTVAPNSWATPTNPNPGITAKQKAGLHNSFGIAKLQDDDGYLNVKLGFDGYNDVKTKRWPSGQPNQMIARAVERGTSLLQPTAFMKSSVSKARSACIKAMKETADGEIQKIMKG